MMTRYEFRRDYPKDLRKIGTKPAIINASTVWSSALAQLISELTNCYTAIKTDLEIWVAQRSIPNEIWPHIGYAMLIGYSVFAAILIIHRIIWSA